jgi:ribulose-bisphosphate carboxylase small chain
MHITQGTFSYLPELSDDEITAQVKYGLENNWAPAVEFTDDPHPRNVYWEMWGLPMFDTEDPAEVVTEINNCRETHPDNYIRLTLYNPAITKMTTALQFIVHRPPNEPGFRLDRQETHDRTINYTLHPYTADKPHGQRYQD